MKAIFLAGQLTLESENKEDIKALAAITEELNNNKITYSAFGIPSGCLYLTLGIVPIKDYRIKEEAKSASK